MIFVALFGLGLFALVVVVVLFSVRRRLFGGRPDSFFRKGSQL